MKRDHGSDPSTSDAASEYDAAGRLVRLENAHAALEYSYDGAGQLLAETVAVPGQSAFTTTYCYEADGQRASTTYPGGPLVERTYTTRGEPETVSLDGAALAWYDYDMAGRRIARHFENGAGDFRTFDALGRATDIEHRSLAGVLATLAYTHDAVGNRTSKTVGGPSVPAVDETYTYDPVDQLVTAAYLLGQASTPTRTVAYSYDPVGNRQLLTDNGSATAYSTNALNQYSAITASGTTTNPAYDPNGNLATLGAGAAYTYDSENRLVRAEVGGVVTTFAHDPRGRVVTRTINGVATHLVYDDWSLVEDHRSVGTLGGDCAKRSPQGRDERERASQLTRDATGALERFYVHGAAIDEVLAQIDTTGPLYFHQDALGSTVLLTDEAGAAVECYSYDAFGKVQGFDSSFSLLPSSMLKTRFLFTGREWLADAKLYDYRHRAHSPTLGRFLQTDPIRFAAGDFNIYRYVANNPANWVDPWGLEPGFGSPGARELTDEQKQELFGYSEKELADERKDDQEILDEASDVMKDVMATPIKPVSKVGKVIKAIVKKIWKETDPGEKSSQCSEK